MDKKRSSIVIIFLILFFQLFTSVAVANEFPAVQKSTNSGQIVSITFDVEGGTDIENVLDTLSAYQVKATFFLLGTWVERYPILAGRIIKEGHEIGNHSYNHPRLTRLSKTQIIKDIQKAEAVIVNKTGASPRPFFRPPYGDTNARVHQAVGEAGYSYSCLWSIDPRDWDGKSARKITNLILDNLHPGAIILCHINRTNTPEALPDILNGIIQKGYTVRLLSQQIGHTQRAIRQTFIHEVETSRQFSIDGVEANFAVNGQLIAMPNRPRIISNRIFVPVRELAKILDGKVFWNGSNKQVILTVGDQSFQFYINGDTLINKEKIVGMPSAILINNKSMVPVFVISKQLGIPITWESRTRTANLFLETNIMEKYGAGITNY